MDAKRVGRIQYSGCAEKRKFGIQSLPDDPECYSDFLKFDNRNPDVDDFLKFDNRNPDVDDFFKSQ